MKQNNKIWNQLAAFRKTAEKKYVNYRNNCILNWFVQVKRKNESVISKRIS